MIKKQEQNIFYANVNVNLMVENVIQVKIGITINAIEGVKIRENIMYGKKIIFGILIHVLVKIVNIKDVSLVIQ